MTELLISGGVMAALGLILSAVLAVANKKLYVYEDPRIDMVEELLPSANCGACGQAGCRAFAERLVEGTMSPAKCTVSSGETQTFIAAFLGVSMSAEEKRVARLACAGGNNVAWRRARYEGIPSCRAALLIGGGGKGCVWGCLGLGDCDVSCPFDAIVMNSQGLPEVIEDRCTACGNCVDACPLDLFSIHPVSHKLWVACKNRAAGEEAEAQCDVACTACGRCAMDAATNLVAIEDNLATVDYDYNARATRGAIERCPTGAIVWWEGPGSAVKGPKAKKITRKSPLPIG